MRAAILGHFVGRFFALVKDLMSTAQRLAGKRIALVGFDGVESSRLASLLATERCLSRRFERAEVMRAPEKLRSVDVVAIRGSEDVARLAGLAARPILVVWPTDHPGQNDEQVAFPQARFSQEEFAPALRRLVGQSDPQSGSEFRAIVADDDPCIQRICKTLLQNFRMECHTATNGEQALALTRELMPNLVLLDVEMPKLSGFEVLQRIRQDSATRGAIVLLLTGRRGSQDVALGSRLGADAYLVKPFTAMEMATRIRHVVSSVLSA